jgi:putative colanic acid biosysnthesis UDP-glucose lipid carrier transferase
VTAVQQALEEANRPARANGRRSFAVVMRLLPGLVMVLDCLALLSLGFATYFLMVFYSYKTFDYYVAAIVGNTMLSVMLMYFGGMYQFGALTNVVKSVDRIALAAFTSFVLMLAAAFTIKISEVYSRLWVGAFMIGGVLAVVLLRSIVSIAVSSLAAKGIVARNTAIYGQGEQVGELMRFLREAGNPFVNVIGVFIDAPSRREGERGATNPELDKIMELVRSDSVDDVIVAMPWADARGVSEALGRLRELPVNVYLGSDMVGYKVPMRAPPSYFEPMPLFHVSGKPLSGWDVILKSLEDYLISLVLVVVLSPLLLLVAVLIKLDSPGPVIFKQKRLGFNNQEFFIYKFRSMTHEQQSGGKTVQAQKHDPRVTRIGRILRKTSIDEIPQLFNVLDGTMSIVGPRPHAIDHNEEFATKIRGYFGRHRVKPGLTGLAQVKGFRGLTDTVEKMENRVKYDVEYTENWSLWLDIKILLQTPLIVLMGTNAH